MAKMVKGKLQVSSADLDKLVKDHGLDKPLKPGKMQFVDRNGNTRVFDLDAETKKLDQFMKMFGGLK